MVLPGSAGALAGVGGGPALLVESFEAVQEDVQAEFELELVVAASTNWRGCVVGPDPGDLAEVGVRGGQLAEQGRPLVPGSAGGGGVGKTSRVNPHILLPRACITWWTRSAESPPARSSPMSEFM